MILYIYVYIYIYMYIYIYIYIWVGGGIWEVGVACNGGTGVVGM